MFYLQGDISVLILKLLLTKNPHVEAMLAAYDVLSRIFGQKAIIDAYYATDPDTMDVRKD